MKTAKRAVILTMMLTLAGAGAWAQQTSAATTPAPSQAELLKELAQMQKRIAQIEAQLAAQGGQPAPAGQPPAPTPPATAPAAAPAPAVAAAPAVDNQTPFAFADFTWMNGNSRNTESPLEGKVFSGEFRADTSYIQDFAHPIDHTLDGTSESGRTDEFQVQQLGVGGDFHYDHAIGRLMTQFGMYSTMTPRNDPTSSPEFGQWDLGDAYRYISEAYGGYQWDALHGVNVEAGIFMSYIGLFSYYNFDNWAYQPSYVSSNTPWFFNGMRSQIYPTNKLKIEPWLINGWQSYGSANNRKGIGGQIAYRPTGNWAFILNQYALGRDTVGVANRSRFHTDDSMEWKYFDTPDATLDKMAMTLTVDAGCESGGGVTCFSNTTGTPRQYFIGAMVYNRFWFDRDRYAITLGGGAINNPGRYLVLLPPINGATAFSGTPYFTENPGDPFKAWDASMTFDYMPSQFVTFRFEPEHRASNVPYFAGPGGETPPGGNTGAAGSMVPGWAPDLRKFENRLNMALLVKF